MKISIITPSFNSAKYIGKAIQSVLNQDYDNWEHIIIDGGSSDNTIDVLKSHTHLKWISEPDKGQSDAMNKGFRMSTGDIIVYLNADDWFEEGVFSKVTGLFEKCDAHILVSNLRIINTTKGTEEILVPSVKYEEILKYWKYTFPVNPVSYFYRREVQSGYQFPLANHHTMDLDFLLYAFKYFRTQHVPEIFGTFLLDGHNKTSIMDTEKAKIEAYLNHCSRYNFFLYLKWHIGRALRKVKSQTKLP